VERGTAGAPVRIGIVTVSDRASRGVYEDRGGPAIRDYLAEVLTSPWEPCARVVEDEVEQIAAALRELCDEEGCCLVVTTGGTGPAARDVTPEATLAVSEKEMPGFGELMRQVSLLAVPTAILSRQTAGIRGSSLIVNLPGGQELPAAFLESILDLFPLIAARLASVDEAPAIDAVQVPPAPELTQPKSGALNQEEFAAFLRRRNRGK